MARRPRSITPYIQFMVMCEGVDMDQGGGVSFRRIFDTLTPAGFPALLQFAISTQFRGGTGEHKFWLKIEGPGGVDVTNQETSFWLASQSAAHRTDARFQVGVDANAVGRWTITAMLDGREAMKIPMTINPASGFIVMAPNQT